MADIIDLGIKTKKLYDAFEKTEEIKKKAEILSRLDSVLIIYYPAELRLLKMIKKRLMH